MDYKVNIIEEFYGIWGFVSGNIRIPTDSIHMKYLVAGNNLQSPSENWTVWYSNGHFPDTVFVRFSDHST
jgi:hypothetical protein